MKIPPDECLRNVFSIKELLDWTRPVSSGGARRVFLRGDFFLPSPRVYDFPC